MNTRLFSLLAADRSDADDDGIPDDDDRCPETRKGTRVDFDGCPLGKK